MVLEVLSVVSGFHQGSQYLIWEVSGTEVQYFDLLQSDLAVSAPCNVTREPEPVPNQSNASEPGEFPEDLTPRSTEWPGCIEVGISR